MSKESETVRFQVPVREDVAKAVERLAKDLDRPSSWLAVELIKASLEDQQSFCDWIGLTFMGTAYDTIKKLAGRRPKAESDSKETRLQLTVPTDVVEKVNKLALQWNQSPVSTAGKLLASGVHNNQLFIEAIALGKRWSGRTAKSKAGGSSADGRNVRHAEIM